jgi:5-carboxymethyl-2-hydroxymuconate isomerase
MPRKQKNNANVKPTDARKTNGKNQPSSKVIKSRLASTTPAKLNQAKKDLISTYAVNAMKKVFGSEAEAWETLAEQAKDSFAHMNLLFQYGYGKPIEKKKENDTQKSNAPVINFFASTEQTRQLEDTIDITDQQIDDEDRG